MVNRDWRHREDNKMKRVSVSVQNDYLERMSRPDQ
jgi:hypothetical protein